VGFCLDGDGDGDSREFVIYSRPDAHRLKHIRERPDGVSFHFDSDGHGQDIIVLHGRVAVDDDHPAIRDWPPYLEKYGPEVERAFGSIAKFSETYSVALRVTITGVRGFYVRGLGAAARSLAFDRRHLGLRLALKPVMTAAVSPCR
jgi:PPOX class probable F420-dependent enzyme